MQPKLVISVEQREKLYNLTKMVDYLTHASTCTMCMEVSQQLQVNDEQITGFMLLSEYCVMQMRGVLDDISCIDASAAHG